MFRVCSALLTAGPFGAGCFVRGHVSEANVSVMSRVAVSLHFGKGWHSDRHQSLSIGLEAVAALELPHHTVNSFCFTSEVGGAGKAELDFAKNLLVCKLEVVVLC
jgi:hypothetical protein